MTGTVTISPGRTQGGGHLTLTVKAVLVLIPQDRAMLLDNVAVSPDAQGLGLGRRMLAFAEHAATASGYCAIKLYTNEAMTENIALYTRLGYVETHRAEEKGLRRVHMEKHLAPAGSQPASLAAQESRIASRDSR